MITMGCRVNQAESERLGQLGRLNGMRPAAAGERPDLVIVNTCSVTGESDRQARQAIRREARNHPGARIIVTGCYAQRAPESLAALPGVTMVLGNGEKPSFWEQVAEEGTPAADAGETGASAEALRAVAIRVGDVAEMAHMAGAPVVDAESGRSRAFLQVQDGCDRRCTFCLIPGVRGAGRSLPMAEVLAQAQRFQEAGFRELVLTGINLGSYGRDLSPPTSLARLLDALAEAPGAARLRLSSLDPRDLDDALLERFAAHRRLCPHLHLSVQSGDDLILKRMGREYGRGLILERTARLRTLRPEAVLGADLIVGFPTEDEAAFARTVDLVERAELALLHVFRYSDRPGTPAAAIPARFRVSGDRIRARSERLRAAGGRVWERVARSWMGKRVEILLESPENRVVRGRMACFLPVEVPAREAWRAGDVVRVRIDDIDPRRQVLRGSY